MCANIVAGGYLQDGKAADQNIGQTDDRKLDTVLGLLVRFCAVHAHAAWLVYTLLLTVSLMIWREWKVKLKPLYTGACTAPLICYHYLTRTFSYLSPASHTSALPSDHAPGICQTLASTLTGNMRISIKSTCCPYSANVAPSNYWPARESQRNTLISCACLQDLPDLLASSMPGIRKAALELAASALKAGPGSPPKHVVPSALKLILSGVVLSSCCYAC